MPAGGLLLGISESSFPRKWESRMSNLKKPFYPISSYADGPGFPPERE
ncbi:pilS cassette protein [Neisseria gonorrhoeae]|nr:pilS cassette protein [Neisseria gonorrhoeae]ROU24109.1 pilS cassette protein [Neisseria gonorrhoeae]ROU33683.1 pilS cassette protein [Neisseria gonorrhoeae]ROU66839.1 pilS cassette protein [Neisseria gonorrhoeae]